MTTFGIVSIPTHYSVQPMDMARWAEENGFDSLFYGEHTHIPTAGNAFSAGRWSYRCITLSFLTPSLP